MRVEGLPGQRACYIALDHLIWESGDKFFSVLVDLSVQGVKSRDGVPVA
jgi:hypothetical protein